MSSRRSQRRTQRQGAPESDPLATRSSHNETDSDWERLNRLARWVRIGRTADAELELHEWLAKDICPPIAVALLAALLARRNEFEMFLGVLGRIDSTADRALGQLLVIVLTRTDQVEAAKRSALILYDTCAEDDNLAAWLDLMQIPGGEETPNRQQASAARLAAQLVEQPSIITTLVAAARCSDDLVLAQQLRQAIEVAAEFLTGEDQVPIVCQAMSHLSLLLSEPEIALSWAHRGLKLNPYQVQLALVLAEAADDRAIGPPANRVLARVAEANPDYPDVQAALIRRAAADGLGKQAQLHLKRWLDRAPGDRLAQRVQGELAA